MESNITRKYVGVSDKVKQFGDVATMENDSNNLKFLCGNSLPCNL